LQAKTKKVAKATFKVSKTTATLTLPLTNQIIADFVAISKLPRDKKQANM